MKLSRLTTSSIYQEVRLPLPVVSRRRLARVLVTRSMNVSLCRNTTCVLTTAIIALQHSTETLPISIPSNCWTASLYGCGFPPSKRKRPMLFHHSCFQSSIHWSLLAQADTWTMGGASQAMIRRRSRMHSWALRTWAHTTGPTEVYSSGVRLSNLALTSRLKLYVKSWTRLYSIEIESKRDGWMAVRRSNSHWTA